MRTRLSLALLLTASVLGPASVVSGLLPTAHAQQAPPGRMTPDAMADQVKATLDADPKASLTELAANPSVDPWGVCDVLLARGHRDAAIALAKAAKGPNNEGLAAYVEGLDDWQQKDARASFAAARSSGSAQEAIRAFGPAVAARGTVISILARRTRASAMRSIGRVEEFAEEMMLAGDEAREMGWLIGALAAYEQGANGASSSDRDDLTIPFREAALEVAEATEEPKRIGRAMTLLGMNLYNAGQYTRSLPVLERVMPLLIEHELWSLRGTAAAPLALSYRQVGRLDDARNLLHEVIEEQRNGGDPRLVADLLGKLGIVHKNAGDLGAAMECFQASHDGFMAAGLSRAARQSLNNIGVIHQSRLDYVRALEVFERVRELAIQEGNEYDATISLYGMAGVNRALGRHEVARDQLLRLKAFAQRIRHPAWEARTSNTLGGVYVALGDYPAGFKEYEHALAIYRELGAVSDATGPLGNLAALHLELGAPGRAIEILEGLAKQHDASGERPDLLSAYRSLALAHSFAGDEETCIAYERRAIELAKEMGLASEIPNSLVTISRSLKRLTRYEEALEVMEQALAMIGEPAPGSLHTTLLMNSAAVLNILGRDDEALARLERAEELSGEGADPRGQVMLHRNFASVAYGAGRYDEALLRVRRGISITQGLLQGLAEEQSAGGREIYAKLFELGYDVAMAKEDPAEFSWFVEHGRAGSLRESLSSRSALEAATVPKELLRGLEDARAEAQRALAAVRAAREARKLEAVRQAKAELEAAEVAVIEASERIQREAKAAASFGLGGVDSLEAIQARLGADEVYVAYARSIDQFYALVVGSDTARIVRTGTAQELSPGVGAMLDLKKAPGSDASAPEAEIAAVRRLLVDPLGLPKSVKRVLVSPTAGLGYLPFGLLFPDHDLAYLPSGTVHGLLLEDAGKSGKGVLAIGDPDYSKTADDAVALAQRAGTAFKLAQLPGTRTEVEAVGTRKLLGADATESKVIAALKEQERWRAVHFACHGLVSAERPLLSSLALTAGDGDDGFLSCVEILRTKVPADLVVLSACETAQGRVLQTEGIVGLTRSFLFAGSPRVICSLWKVDDLATSALMKKFYELWNPEDGDGLSAAAALRAAQAHIRAQEGWEHPYFWAAWVLWGLPE